MKRILSLLVLLFVLQGCYTTLEPVRPMRREVVVITRPTYSPYRNFYIPLYYRPWVMNSPVQVHRNQPESREKVTPRPMQGRGQMGRKEVSRPSRPVPPSVQRPEGRQPASQHNRRMRQERSTPTVPLTAQIQEPISEEEIQMNRESW